MPNIKVRGTRLPKNCPKPSPEWIILELSTACVTEAVITRKTRRQAMERTEILAYEFYGMTQERLERIAQNLVEKKSKKPEFEDLLKMNDLLGG